jgi:Flp pilus assembly protein TadB
MTKENFISAWNNNTPKWLERFYYQHFSSSAENNRAGWIVFFSFLTPFIIGFATTVAGSDETLIKIATFSYTGLLVAFAIPWIYVWFKHNARIKRIMKELDCSKTQYLFAVKQWGELVK